jgi:hypothetical protein
MTASALTVTSRPRLLTPDLAATQRRAAGLVTRTAAQRAERQALDKPTAAATQNVAITTHLNRPDLSHFLDTGQHWNAGVVGGLERCGRYRSPGSRLAAGLREPAAGRHRHRSLPVAIARPPPIPALGVEGRASPGRSNRLPLGSGMGHDPRLGTLFRA